MKCLVDAFRGFMESRRGRRESIWYGLWFYFFWIVIISPALASNFVPGEIGANKFDLVKQYLGLASGGTGTPAYRRVTSAMASKAINDAVDTGFTFFRISATGYEPSRPATGQGDLSEWLDKPELYWMDVDMMFDALDAAHLRLVPSFVWNVDQFPAITGENTSNLIKSATSRSRVLLTRYIKEFITRYKRRSTILFYEMGNELDLLADIDQVTNCRNKFRIRASVICSSVGNYSTRDMIAFSTDIVSMIRHLDPTRGVSSGFASSRINGAHLELHPQFAAEGPDWTADSRVELTEHMRRVNAPFDIISLHLYPEAQKKRSTEGIYSETDLATFAATLFHPEGKKIFVGEFGATGPSPVYSDIAQLLKRNVVDFAALWAWEFYQVRPYSVFDPAGKDFRVEPGHSEPALSALRSVLRNNVANSKAKPRVVLTWPLPCAYVDHPVELSGVASVGGGAAPSIEFLVNGHQLGTATHFPFHFTFDPKSWSGPTVIVEARVSGAGSQVARFKSQILLDNTSADCSVAP